MDTNPVIQPLLEVDAFHKNASLIFEDIVASIRQKTETITITNLQGPEGGYGVWSSTQSEHKRLFIFQHGDRCRFILMLIKTSEKQLRSNAKHYKDICAKLGVNPIMPLLITWGIFEPRDIDRFKREGNLRRNWVDHVLLLGVPDDKTLADANTYDFNEPISVENKTETDLWLCDKAIVKIRSVTDIHDTTDIEKLVNDLLSM